jgi:hypothetical protein
VISELISEVFNRIGHTWTLKAGGHVVPSEEDVDEMLDIAAKRLYDSPDDSQFESGGIIVRKDTTGHDVFVYVGRYY